MKIARNEPCPCMSGKKFKKCCISTEQPVHMQLIDELQTRLDEQKEQVKPAAQAEFTQELLEQCNALLAKINQENPELAPVQAELAELSAKHPNNYYVAYVQGILADKLGQSIEAVKYLEQAIKIYPLFAEAYYNLGYVYFQQDDILGTIACLKKVLEIEKIDGQNQELSQASQEMLKSLADSIKAQYHCNLEEYIKFITILERADNCFNAKQYKKAIALYEQALAFNAGLPEVYQKLAYAYNSLGQTDLALKYFSELIKLDPSYIEKITQDLAAEQDSAQVAAEPLMQSAEQPADQL